MGICPRCGFAHLKGRPALRRPAKKGFSTSSSRSGLGEVHSQCCRLPLSKTDGHLKPFQILLRRLPAKRHSMGAEEGPHVRLERRRGEPRDAFMAGLKNRRTKLKGRCAPDICKWFDACGGAMRVRADLVYNDPWAPEPACYLTDEEIGFTTEKQDTVRARGEDFPMPAFSRPPRTVSPQALDTPSAICCTGGTDV